MVGKHTHDLLKTKHCQESDRPMRRVLPEKETGPSPIYRSVVLVFPPPQSAARDVVC
jgi:hypothetical protein